MLESIRKYLCRRRWREGKTLSRFIALDIRRDIEVISAAHIDDGIITARVRTTNVLYEIRGLAPRAEFGPAMDISVEEAWRWSGPRWGGLPDDNEPVN